MVSIDSLEVARTKVLVRIEMFFAWVMDELDELLMGLNSHKVRKSARFFFAFCAIYF